MLYREEVIVQGLELNLDDGEIEGIVFGEVLDSAARRTLGCFCVVGEII